ncbi:MAG: UvrD-helicase domain-containing protein [Candidatus Hydrothermia bacterium]
MTELFCSRVTSPYNFILVPTSAGSGKTELLARRFVYWLLKDCFVPEDLQHFLAITFTREAAKEMKRRILDVLGNLKKGNFNRYPEFINAFNNRPNDLMTRARNVYFLVLENYPRLQVRTIDSFFDSLRKMILLELDISPNLQISTKIDREVFDVVLESLISLEDNEDKVLKIARDLAGSSDTYNWDVFSEITQNLVNLAVKEGKTLSEVKPLSEYLAIKSDSPDGNGISTGIANLFNATFRGKGVKEGITFLNFLEILSDRADNNIRNFGLYLKQNSELFNEFQQGVLSALLRYNHINDATVDFYNNIYKSRYLEVLKKLRFMTIDDTSRILYSYLSNESDISTRVISFLTKFKYILIDEFQDTDPQQWGILLFVIREALSKGFHVFLVGDVKQSIYEFRNADYKIMYTLMSEDGYRKYQLNQSPQILSGMDINFRSAPEIVRFVNEQVFINNVFERFLKSQLSILLRDVFSEGSITEKVNELAILLQNIWVPINQTPYREDTVGFVSNIKISHGEEDELKGIELATGNILEILNDVIQRFRMGDISILTYRNDDVNKIASMLREEGYPVISYSSLDIRSHRILAELVALLKFAKNSKDKASALILSTGLIASTLSGKSQEELALELSKVIHSTPDILKKYIENLLNLSFDGIQESLMKEPISHIFIKIVNTLLANPNLFRDASGVLCRFSNYLYTLEAKKGFLSLKDVEYTLEEFANNFKNNEDELSFPQNLNLNAIRVMTFHKAKGLGFPVVINLFANKFEPWRITDFSHIETKGEERHLYFYRLKKALTLPFKFQMVDDDRYQRIVESSIQRKIDQLVQEINTLYVALTRAREELYNIYFENTLVANLFSLAGVDNKAFGEKVSNKDGEKVKNREGEKGDKRELITSVPILKYEPKLPPPVEDNMPRENPETSMGPLNRVYDRLLGEAIHDFLKDIEFLDKVDDFEKFEDKLKFYLQKYNLHHIGHLMILNKLKSFFEREERIRYLRKLPGSKVYREKEVLLKDGNLMRIDRIIETPEEVLIIDFKTGEPVTMDVDQVKNYMVILKEIYRDRVIKGHLLYLFSDRVVVVDYV